MSCEQIDVISRYLCVLLTCPFSHFDNIVSLFNVHHYCMCIRSFLSIFNCSLSKKYESQFYQFFQIHFFSEFIAHFCLVGHSYQTFHCQNFKAFFFQFLPCPSICLENFWTGSKIV